MTIKQAITKGMIMLKSNNVESPKLKARLLLQYVLDKPRQYIIVYDNKEIDKQQQWQYFVNIEKLTKGIPLQHITHRQEFMKMDFFVDENVLIPRPDTEILVEEVIKIAQKYDSPRILDLCTGSGAIAISLKKFVPNADITAVDISEKALEIAQKNAKKLETKINFLKSDLFDKLDNKKFDIIVSNPPYIRKDEIKKLSEEVQKEPKIIDYVDKLNKKYSKEALEQVEINHKYEGYIIKAKKEAEKMIKLGKKQIPEDIDYEKVDNLATEARQKLEKIRPRTIDQATRISGVNPSDIAILMVYLKRFYNE